MSIASRLRMCTALFALGLWLAWIWSLGSTLIAALRAHHFQQGLLAHVILDLRDALAAHVAGGVILTVALLAAWRWRDRDGSPAPRWLELGTGTLPGLLIFFPWALHLNRLHFTAPWLRRRALAGVELPRALFRADVWALNAGLFLLCAGLSFLAFLLLRRWMAARAKRGHAWERSLTHPLALGLLVLALSLPTWLSGLIRAGAREQASIVLISLDTLRADHLGLYGYERPTSPRLDALAGESFVFEWAFSPAPNTPPAHMSLFTSLYPSAHGFTGNYDRLAAAQLTLGEYLRERGYRSFASTDGGYMQGDVGFGQGFERFDDARKGIAASVGLALHWLDTEITDQTFGLFLHCYDIHGPYGAPEPYHGSFADPNYDGDFEPTTAGLAQARRASHQAPAFDHGLTQGEIEYMIARYDEGILYTDAWVGQLLDGLDARGVLDRSWIIVLSDHGEEFTEHGSVLHDKLYHTVTRVPLLIRPPGGRPRERREPKIVELTDVLPTILDIIGQAPAGPMQGRSLMPFLREENPSWSERAFAEHPWFGQRRAITTPSLQLLSSLDGAEREAYRYRDDPLELRPLGDTALDEVDSCLSELLQWSDAQARWAQDGVPIIELGAMAKERAAELRALGYVD